MDKTFAPERFMCTFCAKELTSLVYQRWVYVSYIYDISSFFCILIDWCEETFSWAKLHGDLSEADVKYHCYSGLVRQRKNHDGFQTISKYSRRHRPFALQWTDRKLTFYQLNYSWVIIIYIVDVSIQNLHLKSISYK